MSMNWGFFGPELFWHLRSLKGRKKTDDYYGIRSSGVTETDTHIPLSHRVPEIGKVGHD
jgi:hypothetical protein